MDICHKKYSLKRQMSHFRIQNNVRCICTHTGLYIVHTLLYACKSLCCAYGCLYITIYGAGDRFLLTHKWSHEYSLKWNKFLNLTMSNKNIKNTLFWNVTACCLVHWYKYFRSTCYLFLQGRSFKKTAAGSFRKFLRPCQTTRNHITKCLLYREYLTKIGVKRTFTETNSCSTNNCIIITNHQRKRDLIAWPPAYTYLSGGFFLHVR